MGNPFIDEVDGPVARTVDGRGGVRVIPAPKGAKEGQGGSQSKAGDSLRKKLSAGDPGGNIDLSKPPAGRFDAYLIANGLMADPSKPPQQTVDQIDNGRALMMGRGGPRSVPATPGMREGQGQADPGAEALRARLGSMDPGGNIDLSKPPQMKKPASKLSDAAAVQAAKAFLKITKTGPDADSARIVLHINGAKP